MQSSIDPIDDLLRRMKTLPPAPKIMPQLLGVLGNLDADVSRVVELITYDPALTAKVLQVCNSAYYAMPVKVSTVANAVNRIGFQGIYTIVAVASSEVFIDNDRQSAIDADALWRHLIRSAVAAQFLAGKVGADPSMLFTAGLLHDVGKLPIAEVMQGDYDRLVTDQVLFGRSLATIEDASFGLNHAEVGARLLETWSFAPELIAAVRWHHDCGSAGDDCPLAACVELGDLVAHSLGDDDEDPFATVDPRPALAVAELTFEDLGEVRSRVRETAAMIDAMCGD